MSGFCYVSLYKVGKRAWEVVINGAKWSFNSYKRAVAFYNKAKGGKDEE